MYHKMRNTDKVSGGSVCTLLIMVGVNKENANNGPSLGCASAGVGAFLSRATHNPM